MQYPEFLYENMGELADYLLAPPTPDELDERGCMSKETCVQIERMLLKDFEKKLKGLYMPGEPPKGVNPNNKWRTVSCLQKAIRFGDREMARFAASVGYDMDAKYVVRRLGIIAVEDVAIGNLYGTLVTLAMLGNAAWRQACDERRLCIAVADMLASQYQDRNLTDWLNMASFDPNFDRETLAKAPNEELEALVLDKGVDPAVRMGSLWLMAGTKRYWGLNMPKTNDRPATPVFQLMAKQGLSRAMLYGAARTASRLNEAFWVSFYFAHEQLTETDAVAVIPDPIEYPKVGKLLAAAYDMHTREGKIAIGKFSHSCKEVMAFKPLLAPSADYQLLVSEAVFAVEGGRLRNRVHYGNSEEIRARSWRNILSFFGLPAEHHAGLLHAVEANLSYLNKIREKVLWQKLNAA